MNDTRHDPGDRAPRTWRERLEASLLIGALVSAAWTGVVATAGWPLDTTENLEGLLNAALNNFINVSVLAFLIQTIWFWVRTRGGGPHSSCTESLHLELLLDRYRLLCRQTGVAPQGGRA